MLISEISDRLVIAPGVSASSKRQVLATIADIAARRFALSADAVTEALTERERLSSTGVGYGVAVPHARLKSLSQMCGVFIRLEHPVEFGAVDDQPVDLVFALLSPSKSNGEHLRTLARMSRILGQVKLREQLRQAHTVDAIHVLLSQEARPTGA